MHFAIYEINPYSIDGPYIPAMNDGVLRPVGYVNFRWPANTDFARRQKYYPSAKPFRPAFSLRSRPSEAAPALPALTPSPSL